MCGFLIHECFLFFFFFFLVSSTHSVLCVSVCVFSRVFGRQEKLESCLFKLRIAERKNRGTKVAKMHKKINRLRRRLAGEPVGSDEGEEVREARFVFSDLAPFPHRPLPPVPRTPLSNSYFVFAPVACIVFRHLSNLPHKWKLELIPQHHNVSCLFLYICI